MRLINADALYTLFVKMKSFGELTAKKAIRYVEEAPTVEAIPFKWTPFKKQKPPKTDDYLITYPLGVGRARYVTIATWHSVLEMWEGFRTEAVIAWAEIPKPYGDEL